MMREGNSIGKPFERKGTTPISSKVIKLHFLQCRKFFESNFFHHFLFSFLHFIFFFHFISNFFFFLLWLKWLDIILHSVCKTQHFFFFLHVAAIGCDISYHHKFVVLWSNAYNATFYICQKTEWKISVFECFKKHSTVGLNAFFFLSFDFFSLSLDFFGFRLILA